MISTQGNLAVEDLNALEPHQIFATGVMEDSPLGLHMSGSGRELRWVAVRGGIPDWTIYCHFANHSPEWIRDQGDKVPPEYIQRLVPCTKEVEGRYRL